MSHLARVVVRPFLRPITRQFTTTSSLKAWIPIGAMKRGPKYFMGMWGSENGLNSWVLMPGVPKENVSVKVIGNQVFFQGTEVLHVPGLRGSEDDILREYKGSFHVDTDRFDAEKLKAEIVDGIFWLHIPKLSH